MGQGKIYIVATPLGNLSDISTRQIEVLRQVALIAAEDTRHSRKLLVHLDVQTPLCAYHDHNETQMTTKLIAKCQEGQDIALISDAGTPLINDPGFRLVAEALQEGVQVVPVPGPCALITALCVSGLPAERFVFEGFLPAKSGLRQKKLEALASEARTIIFYESPHRILAAMADVIKVFGPSHECVIARELTKVYETIKKGPAGTLLQWLEDEPNEQRGEFVLLLSGVGEKQGDVEEQHRVLSILSKELPLKQAAKLTAEITGGRKNELYQWALAQQAS